MTKNQAKEAFKREHEKFCWFRSLSIWDGERIRNHFTRKEVILHEMLYEEVFYLWDDDNVKRALTYIQEVFPDVTEEEMRKVYEESSEIVTAVYG